MFVVGFFWGCPACIFNVLGNGIVHKFAGLHRKGLGCCHAFYMAAMLQLYIHKYISQLTLTRRKC